MPDVTANKDVLGVSSVLDSDLMLSAGGSTALSCVSGFFLGIPDHQEVLKVPTKGILVDLSDREVDHVRVDVHVEDTIVRKELIALSNSRKLILDCLSPARGVAIGPGSSILFRTPWVSDLDQSDIVIVCVLDSVAANNSVGMTACNTLIGGIIVRSAEVRAGSDDISIHVGFSEDAPDLVGVEATMVVVEER